MPEALCGETSLHNTPMVEPGRGETTLTLRKGALKTTTRDIGAGQRKSGDGQASARPRPTSPRAATAIGGNGGKPVRAKLYPDDEGGEEGDNNGGSDGKKKKKKSSSSTPPPCLPHSPSCPHPAPTIARSYGTEPPVESRMNHRPSPSRSATPSKFTVPSNEPTRCTRPGVWAAL